MPFSTIYSSSDDYLNGENDKTKDAVLIDKVCLQSATIPNILLVGSVNNLPETFTQLNTLPNVILSLASIDTLTVPNNANNVFVVIDMQTVESPLYYTYNIKLTDKMPDNVIYSSQSDSNANITINNYSKFTKQTTAQQFTFNEGNYTVNDYVNNDTILKGIHHWLLTCLVSQMVSYPYWVLYRLHKRTYKPFTTRLGKQSFVNKLEIQPNILHILAA